MHREQLVDEIAEIIDDDEKLHEIVQASMDTDQPEKYLSGVLDDLSIKSQCKPESNGITVVEVHRMKQKRKLDEPQRVSVGFALHRSDVDKFCGPSWNYIKHIDGLPEHDLYKSRDEAAEQAGRLSESLAMATRSVKEPGRWETIKLLISERAGNVKHANQVKLSLTLEETIKVDAIKRACNAAHVKIGDKVVSSHADVVRYLLSLINGRRLGL